MTIYHIDLNTVIKQLDPMYFDYLRHIKHQIPLPTEFTISEPKHCIPWYGRVYSTGLYILPKDNRELIVDYSTLLEEKQPFDGTSHYEDVYLCEVWQNDGYDGHVEMYLYGWRFMRGSMLKQIMQTKHKCCVFNYPGYEESYTI